MSQKPSAYRDAGVDIDAKYAAVGSAREAIRSTFTKGVVGDVGAFGGLFDLAAAGADGQLLVASTDGVGTKVKVAMAAGRLSGVGEDLVNHCIDDILVQGARPLFFLDYIAVDRMVPAQVEQVLSGLAKACRESACALLGGETAEMPGVYREGEMDVAGTIIGSVARDTLLDGSKIAVGDVAVVLPSSGLHTNGFSLARKILKDRGIDLADTPAELAGASVADGLLAVHRSYWNQVSPWLGTSALHGMAHITGGGLQDNVPRVLPDGTAFRARRDALVDAPPIFDFLVQQGGVDVEEAWRVFNMGFGMVLFVSAAESEAVLTDLRDRGEAAFVGGEVVAGDGAVHFA